MKIILKLGYLLSLNIHQVYVILVFITNEQEMLIPCCCLFINISNDNCKEKPPMRMLDLKRKACILLQLIISYHYNTHNTHLFLHRI